MKTKIIASFFALTVMAQLWVPVSMILSSEKSLDSGMAFKFRITPVDPHDAFRGKYLTLNFEASNLRSDVKHNSTMLPGEEVYAILSEDCNGFAEVIELTENRPKSGYFVKGKIVKFSSETKHFDFPFTKFFLQEDKAEKAEHLYRKQIRTGNMDSYAIIKVNTNGHAVIEDLILGGAPIMESLK
jgi:uncharacterized membrane-anchored protein